MLTFFSAQLLALLRDGFLYHFLSNLLKTEDYSYIGLVVRMSIWDTKGRRFELQHQYVFYLSKRLYPHCFSRLSCEISTRWGQPREGCSVL